jgi:L-2,4-diaminobutyrate decarboxylase
VSEPLFLSAAPAAHRRLREVTDLVVATLARTATGTGPCSSATPGELAQLVAAIDPCPDEGVPVGDVLAEVGGAVLAHGVRPWEPRCTAHLHSPTLLTAAAAELAIGATNQSMDSYDQAPAATLVEDHLVRWLAGVVGLPEGASGVLTAGGTASNLLALLLARDAAVALTPGDGLGRRQDHHDSHDVAADGLPPEAGGWRIVTSDAAHFSVQRAAAVLGLGRRSVVAVATDDHGRMDVDALDATLAGLRDRGHRVIAVVGTAGTTDLGAIDPLPALAERAAELGAWFHVDAAVGSALCVSERLRTWLAGVERADSVTADLHKLWWQPIGASALLVRDAGRLGGLRLPSDYLDRPDDDGEDGDEGVGPLNLVGRSLDTSRRFDALKVLVSLRSTGRRRLAAMVEHLVDTAAGAAALVARRPDVELLAPPSTVTVLFRWRPDAAAPTGPTHRAGLAGPTDPGGRGTPPVPTGPTGHGRAPAGRDGDLAGGDGDLADRANVAVQRRLFASGRAVLGRTRHRGRVALKLTFVNPATTLDDVRRLIDDIAVEGATWLAEQQPTPLEAVR